MLRHPRLWTMLVIILLLQTWPYFRRAKLSTVPLIVTMANPYLLFAVLPVIPGVALGFFLASRQWDRIEIDSTTFTSIKGSKRRSRRRCYDLADIREVRAGSVALIVLVRRPPNSFFRKPKKVILMNGRGAAEVAWVSREIRKFLHLDDDSIA
jgi:hypothetical protein